MARLFFTIILLACLVLGLRYCFEHSPAMQQIDLYALIPKDAVYIVETDRPLEQWQHFKDGKIWQFLQQNDYLAGINTQVEGLNQTLSGKEKALGYILKGKLITSAHVKNGTYNYLYLLDIAQAARIADVPPLLTALLKNSGYEVSNEKYQEQTIYRLYDAATNSALFVAFRGSALAASYDLGLLKQAIGTSLKPYFTSDSLLTDIRTRIGNGGMANIYINHPELLDFAACYANTQQTPLVALGDMLSLSGMNLAIENNFIELQGNSLINNQSQSYLKALITVDKSDLRAAEILPPNTSFFTSICFDDFEKLQQALVQLQGKQPEPEAPENVGDLIAQELSKALKKELPNWIEHEIALALVPKPDDSLQQAYVAVIPLSSKRDMVADKLSKTLYALDQLNPLQFLKKDKDLEYRDYRLVRLPVAGLLRSAGGDIFKDMGKPYLTLIGDYLVFCDDENILKHIIDHYDNGTTLAADAQYNRFFERFKTQSSVFTYIKTNDFYPVLLGKLKNDKRASLIKNKDYLMRFPHWGFQLLPDGDVYKTHFFTDFETLQ